MSSGEWWDDGFVVEEGWKGDPEAYLGECCYYGEVRRVKLEVDPFVLEGIEERDGPDETWCEPCYDTRCMGL